MSLDELEAHLKAGGSYCPRCIEPVYYARHRWRHGWVRQRVLDWNR